MSKANEKKIKALIVDDHALIRRGLNDLLRYEKDITVVGEATDGESAVRACVKLKPDVVIMDLMMPVMDGVQATQQIKSISPSTNILILTTFGTSADVSRAVRAGAAGAVMKDASTDEQLAAIRAVASGGGAFSPEIARTLQEDPPPELTERQLTILESVARGLTNRDVAKMLGISTDAVKQHFAAICAKLGAANRAEAVCIAMGRHLLRQI